jgi:hypothetical protein
LLNLGGFVSRRLETLVSLVAVMTDARIGQYLAKAEECRREAAEAAHHEERAAWLVMAEEWLRLSRSVEQADQDVERKNTRVDGETHPVHSGIVSR